MKPPREAHDERGAGSALAAAVIVFIGATAFWAVLLSAWSGSIHAARSAADMAALSAAHAHLIQHEPCEDAGRVAARNGATMGSCHLRLGADGFVVEVTVTVPLNPRMPGAPESVRAMSSAGLLPLEGQ
ncbi:Rv3654c family TadE-like protein [Propionibacterium sp.]|uniref:Rv3654c family TadE-like protein n=1 Tax=Propionibacterium sp. TaxID=1977903 RepID=UPI0039EAFC9F